MNNNMIIKKYNLDKLYNYTIENLLDGYLITFRETEDADSGWFMLDSNGNNIEM